MFRKKYPHVTQHDQKDCGAACLSMITAFYGSLYPISKFREWISVDNMGASIYGIVEGAKKVGLAASGCAGDYKELTEAIEKKEITLPVIARISNEQEYDHFIVIYEIHKDMLVVGDPAKDRILKMPAEVFREHWLGQIITFSVTDSFVKEDKAKLEFRKFFTYILRQKKLLVWIFVVSLFVALINYFGAVSFQYIMDDCIKESNVTVIKSVETYGDGESECNDPDCEEHNHNPEGDEHEHVHDESEEHNQSRFMDFLDSLEEKLAVIFANLKTVCIATIALYLFGFLLNVLRGGLLAATAKKVDVPLTMEYYNHLMDLPAGFYGTRKTGEYMSRFSDTSKIREAISSTTLTLMLDSLMAIGCGIILWFIEKKLFLITLAIVLVYAIVMYTFKRPIKSLNFGLMEQGAQVDSYLKESIDGIETIKAFNSENESKNRTYNLYNSFASKNAFTSFIYSLLGSLVSSIESVGVVGLLWVGAHFCIKNYISIADLLTFYYLISYFLTPVKNLIDLQPELQSAFVAAERLDDILSVEKEEEGVDENFTIDDDLRLNNIDFRYGKRSLVLQNLSMVFRKGKKTAIVGESGCGKTTIVKLLMKFYSVENGEITIGSDSINTIKPRSLRERMAYVSQDVFLFSDTIYNNLRLGNRDITDGQIEEMCKLCNVHDFILSLPHGYETVLEEKGNNLSGGQKQRLAIVRALLRHPDVLILDEATSNLDVVTEKFIKETIDSISKDMTCIVIAHRLSVVRDCDYIYVMEHGKVAEEGTHNELLDRKGLYASFW